MGQKMSVNFVHYNRDRYNPGLTVWDYNVWNEQ